MKSVIPFKGYGKGTITVYGVYPGYITSTGNYFDFFIPITIPKECNVSLAIENAYIYKDSSNMPYNSNNFDTSYVKVLTNYGVGLRCELKYKTAQSNAATSANINMHYTLTIS